MDLFADLSAPDFGIDEEVKLILYNELTKEYKGASNKHFSLQLKSLDKHERDKFIEKNGVHYIKIQFESSRLGYILRKPPAYGIIVIYDIRDELLYFDYCENIYYNLNEIHKNDRWKNSEKPQPKTFLIKIQLSMFINSWLKDTKMLNYVTLQTPQNTIFRFLRII
jgi:hypothetical protein